MAQQISIKLPDFFEDPYIKPTQEQLFGLGTDILGGKIPSYFKPIGDFGGPLFKRALDTITKQVKTGILETGAKLRSRGGAILETIGKKVGDISSVLGFEDYLRAIKGREFLFTGGKSLVEGVRSAGITQGSLRNEFNLGRSSLELKQALANAELAENAKLRENSFWSNIISGGMGALGTIAGLALAPATGGVSAAVLPLLGSAGGSAGGKGALDLANYAGSSSRLLGDISAYFK